MVLLRQIRSLHQPKPMITSAAIMIKITTTITTTVSTAITVRTRTTTTKIIRSEKLKKTIIALTKMQFTTKTLKHKCRKFENKNIQIFQILKRMKNRQTEMIYHKKN